MELRSIPQVEEETSQEAVGVGERSREGHEMLLDMRSSGVLGQAVLVSKHP